MGHHAASFFALGGRGTLPETLSKQVTEAIRNGARVMVCGGRDMAQGVTRALEDILAPMGLTPAMLKAGGRYVEDVY